MNELNLDLGDQTSNCTNKYDRIRWVQIPANTPHSDSIIWWPALVYDSYHDIQCSISVLQSDLKSHLHRQRHRLFASGKCAKLIGRNLPNGCDNEYYPISKDREHAIVIPYFDYFDEMERRYGKNSKWKAAVADVNTRIFKDVEQAGYLFVQGELDSELEQSTTSDIKNREKSYTNEQNGQFEGRSITSSMDKNSENSIYSSSHETEASPANEDELQTIQYSIKTPVSTEPELLLKSSQSVTTEAKSHEISSLEIDNQSITKNKDIRPFTRTEERDEELKKVEAKRIRPAQKIQKDSDCILEKSCKPTLEEKFQECLGPLCPQMNSSEYIFDGSTINSKFYEFKQNFLDFLTESIQSYKDGIGESSAMYIFGRSGTGKTTMVKYCIELVQEQRVLFVNSAHICTSKSFTDTLVKGIGKHLNGRANDLECIEKKFTANRGTESQPFILVLDEVDTLLSEKSENPVLNKVIKWGLDPRMSFIFIGISNAVGNEKAKSLRQLGRIREIVVQPYTADELMEILKKRLGENIKYIQDVALFYITRKISKKNGDVRYLLGLMSSTLMACKDEFTQDQLSDDNYSSRLVKIGHVTKAIRNFGQLKHSDIIESLPQAQKCVLCIVVTLIEVITSDELNEESHTNTSISLGMIKKYSGEAAMHGVMPRDCSVFELVQGLQDAGLFKANDDANNLHDNDHEIMLAIDMEEIECTLDDTLYKEPSFFLRLREHIKKGGNS